MQINKKTLLMILSISFYGAALCMEQATFEEQEQIRKIVGNQAAHISNFARDNGKDPQHMTLLGTWLATQKSATTDDKTWKRIVDYLNKTVSLCSCHCVPNELTTAVKKVAIEIASELKAGENCSELLIQRSQEAMKDVHMSRAYRLPILGNGEGADWYPAFPTCYCEG